MSEKQADALILEMVECVGQMATLDIAAWMLKEMELDPSGLSGVRQQVEARAMSEMDVRQYRKKPVRIEAARYVGTPLNTSNTPFPRFQKLVDWCGGRIVYTEEVFQFYPTIAIDTLEGTMQASWGDWIIRGVNGEFYPCKDEIFRKTYDPVHMLPDNEGE